MVLITDLIKSSMENMLIKRKKLKKKNIPFLSEMKIKVLLQMYQGWKKFYGEKI